MLLADGVESGVEMIHVRTGAGLAYQVTPTKGMDLSLADFGGSPLTWQSAGGDAHPNYYDASGTGWLRTASGGLLMTCGLMHVGSPETYDGATYGLHGRAHHTPARNVSVEADWIGDEYDMAIRGTVDETAIFGGHLRLQRDIRSRLGDNRITITDRVENVGFSPCPHMMLYHFNFGFPLLTDLTRFKFPESVVEPRDKKTPSVGYDTWSEPNAEVEEQVYYHELVRKAGEEEEIVEVSVFQPEFPLVTDVRIPLTVKLRWNSEPLPQFVQWRMPGAGVHVMGIEPANCRVEGMANEAERGSLRILQPGEAVHYQLELSVEQEESHGFDVE
jgi:galactose mutarotase-like enzyme